jgi:N-acetylneuraminic acid mutarotase
VAVPVEQQGDPLAHQVFVSHATEDLDTASRVCKVLEAEGISCWLASRDVKAGTDYAAAIIDAVKNSQLVLLVFSAYANTSPYVLREIERAVAYNRPVLSLRVDEALPGSSMEYYLNLWQWLDARTGIEKQRHAIATAVRKQLDTEPGAARGTGERPDDRARQPVGPARRRRRVSRTWLVAAGAVVLAAAIAAGAVWVAMRHAQVEAASTTSSSAVATASSSGPDTTTTSSPAPHGLNTPNVWTQLSPSGEIPIRRGDQPMVYDSAHKRFIMFGGAYGGNDPLDETWAYDPGANSWTNLKPEGALPAARVAPAMSYDPLSGRVIMFGGGGAINDQSSDQANHNDTWAYDPSANSWTNLNPKGALPAARAAAAMVYDSTRRRMILFGGSAPADAQLAGADAQMNDTWAYDPAANTWSDLSPAGTLPPERCRHSMVYDRFGGRVIIFGGLGSEWSELNDTWVYETSANTWTKLSFSGTSPYPRHSCSMAYCSWNNTFILFGGAYAQNAGFFNETWVFDPTVNTWTLVPIKGTAPAARGFQSMEYDPDHGQIIMFGGFGATEYLNDTWDYTP